MLSEPAIRVSGLGKCYQIYEKPVDRLKQGLWRGTKRFYREFWALRGASFEVRKGETVGIVGKNGSGKSTLLQLICGTLTPTAGRVDIKGRVAALLELGAGFNPEFTGKENVYINASILGLSREEIDDRYQSIVDFAEIGDFIDRPVKTYSSGMYVRLAFAVMVQASADILIIDEALAVGDVFFTQKCMRYLRDFQKRGTVLFVSHNADAVLGLCDRAVWLEKGQIRQTGRAKEVCESYLASFQEYKGVVSCSPGPRRAPVRSDSFKIESFNPNSACFGDGGATITGVQVESENGNPLTFAEGGEEIAITITAQAHKRIESPILGFGFKDQLGQILFGDNTFLQYRGRGLVLKEGQEIKARFVFRLPNLRLGDYSIYAAIASGTQHDHVQHHWIHDALAFKSRSQSTHTGLVGIPMRVVEVTIGNAVREENETTA